MKIAFQGIEHMAGKEAETMRERKEEGKSMDLQSLWKNGLR